MVYYGRQRQVEFDLVVQPGADPRQIRLEFAGADRIELDAQGDLLVHVGAGVLRQHKPVAYQEREGRRQTVAAAYVVEGRRAAAFRLGGYDPARRLVIDPVLMYSTYFGGSGVEDGMGIAVDGAGNAYIAGRTLSYDFPTSNPLQGTHTGVSWDAFVTKLNAAGSAVVYSTYLGGSHVEFGTGIAVDTSGNAYVTGVTESLDFPTANPQQGTLAGGGGQDAFVTKLNAAGSALVYSTYLGGGAGDFGMGGQDVARAIAVDGNGNAYVTGDTNSLHFPTANALQGTHGGGDDAFVTKLNAAGALAYSTYLGGGGMDYAGQIAVDASGSAYVAGRTTGGFPLASPLQGAHAGGIYDGFVTKLNASGSALVYSTYLGGSWYDYAYGIALDGAGNAYVTGHTESTNFPTVGPLQGALVGSQNAFVTKLNAAGSALVYSTYLGGSGGADGFAIAVDGAGQAYVTGMAGAGFPIVNPVLGALAGTNGDAFVARLNPAGSALAYSTYLGGNRGDIGRAIAVDGVGGAYVTGLTYSLDYRTLNAIQPVNGNGVGDYDAFVAKIATFTKGDVDGDGYADLILRSNADGTRHRAWIMNGVAAVAQANITPDAAGATWKIRGLDDFDGDQRNDLVFWNQATGQVEFWPMNGASRLAAPVPLTGGPTLATSWELAATADFNHDGRADIVWRNVASQKIAIWTMNGAAMVGGIVPTPDQAVDGNWAIVAGADYDNDGNTDFLWYNSTTGKIVNWYMDSSVVRTAGRFTTPANAGDNNWKVVASADYSREHVPGTPPFRSPDIVWRNETSGKQVVWHMDFTGTRVHGEFTSPSADANPLGWTIVAPR